MTDNREELKADDLEPGTLVHKLIRYAEINEDKETRIHGRRATNSWAQAFREAAAEIIALNTRNTPDEVTDAQSIAPYVEALRPFADWRSGILPEDADNKPLMFANPWHGDEHPDALTVGDFRRAARALLSGQQPLDPFDPANGIAYIDPAPDEVKAGEAGYLTAYVSLDGKVVGIDHETDADWHAVRHAHEVLRDRLNERLGAQERCPMRPSTPGPTEVSALVEHFPTGLRSKRQVLMGTSEVLESPVQCDCWCGASFAGTDEQEVRQLWVEHAEKVIRHTSTATGSDRG